jgi:hypothetical protein
VVRPGVVSGDSRTGRTRSFSHFYFFLKVAYLALHPLIMAGSSRGQVQLVPSDFVADAIGRVLTEASAVNRTFHLTAGSRVTTTGEIARLLIQTMRHYQTRGQTGGRGKTRVRFLPVWVFRCVLHPLVWLFGSRRLKRLYRSISAFYAYLNDPKEVDTSHTDSLLQGTAIEIPPLADYFGRLVEYGIAVDWGRKRQPVDSVD